MNEAELTFTRVLDCDRVLLYQNRRSLLGKDKASRIASVLKRRMQGEPLQYILGKQEFMGLEFKVTPDVLIPRPETEILVEEALKIARQLVSRPVSPLRILDMGTGSGCVAVSLAKLLPGAEIEAVDISRDALRIAKENARLNNVRIHFIEGDLFSAFSFQLSAYSLIISNPPYIPTGEIDGLQVEIGYEPKIALDGGKDGLDFYRRLIAQAPPFLRPGGELIMEMGAGQLERISELLHRSRELELTEVVKDYSRLDRIIAARKVDKNG